MDHISYIQNHIGKKFDYMIHSFGSKNMHSDYTSAPGFESEYFQFVILKRGLCLKNKSINLEQYLL